LIALGSLGAPSRPRDIANTGRGIFSRKTPFPCPKSAEVLRGESLAGGVACARAGPLLQDDMVSFGPWDQIEIPCEA
jgi:hypothetical protein